MRTHHYDERESWTAHRAASSPMARIFCRFTMSEEHTTAAVQRYLDALAGDEPAEPIVRALLDRAVRRLHLLCANLLYRSYRRLTLPPLNLQPDELLGAVVERLLKAMRSVRPQTVRQFFALVNQHMRWELNDLARRLDQQPTLVEFDDERVPAAPSQQLRPDTRTGAACCRRSTTLPEDEREVFELLRIQGSDAGARPPKCWASPPRRCSGAEQRARAAGEGTERSAAGLGES